MGKCYFLLLCSLLVHFCYSFCYLYQILFVPLHSVTIRFIIMARTKKTTKAKEPVRIRFKQLANGNQSIYLDCYKDGKRSYEFFTCI